MINIVKKIIPANKIINNTGFPTRRMLEIIINIFKDLDINYYLKLSVHKIQREDQIFITLFEVRVNYGTTDGTSSWLQLRHKQNR